MITTYYTKEHEWLRVEGEIVTVGITDYAQSQLGDLVFVDLPEPRKVVKEGDTVVVVESVKAASDVYCPIDGVVIAVNEDLVADPSLINRDAEAQGWLWQMKMADSSQLSSLLDETAYKTLIG